MSQMINRGKELIRINPSKNRIEYSTNDGRSWIQRCASSSAGEFHTLTDNGKEILAQTSKGLYYSTNEGRSWKEELSNSLLNKNQGQNSISKDSALDIVSGFF